MKIDDLRRLARWTQKLADASRQIADELLQQAEQAEKQRDPLAAHIYQSRALYRRAMDHDRTKHGARIAVTERESYKQAVAFGFRGSLANWRDLLCAEQPQMPPGGLASGSGAAMQAGMQEEH